MGAYGAKFKKWKIRHDKIDHLIRVIDLSFTLFLKIKISLVFLGSLMTD